MEGKTGPCPQEADWQETVDKTQTEPVGNDYVSEPPAQTTQQQISSYQNAPGAQLQAKTGLNAITGNEKNTRKKYIVLMAMRLNKRASQGRRGC